MRPIVHNLKFFFLIFYKQLNEWKPSLERCSVLHSTYVCTVTAYIAYAYIPVGDSCLYSTVVYLIRNVIVRKHVKLPKYLACVLHLYGLICYIHRIYYVCPHTGRAKNFLGLAMFTLYHIFSLGNNFSSTVYALWKATCTRVGIVNIFLLMLDVL